jgi:hypothetical protein
MKKETSNPPTPKDRAWQARLCLERARRGERPAVQVGRHLRGVPNMFAEDGDTSERHPYLDENAAEMAGSYRTSHVRRRLRVNSYEGMTLLRQR